MARSPSTKKFSAETSDEVIQYLDSIFKPEDELLNGIRDRSVAAGLPPIAVGAFDGRLLECLVRSVQANTAIEIGTLGGYSAVCIARGLSKRGHLHVFEMDERCVKVAQENFEKASVVGKITIHHGPALEKLQSFKNGEPLDFVFIDADKENYVEYFKWAKDRVRSGGMIAADNTLAWGMLADQNFETPRDEKLVRALRRYNDFVAADSDFISTMIPTGEGLTLSVKR